MSVLQAKYSEMPFPKIVTVIIYSIRTIDPIHDFYRMGAVAFVMLSPWRGRGSRLRGKAKLEDALEGLPADRHPQALIMLNNK